MAFQKYIHNDPLYVRLGSLLDELDAKLDRALNHFYVKLF